LIAALVTGDDRHVSFAIVRLTSPATTNADSEGLLRERGAKTVVIVVG